MADSEFAFPELLDNFPTPDLRLIPCAIDEYARPQTQDLFCSFPGLSNVNGGFQEVNFGKFSNGINRAATWLEENGCQSKPQAYLAPPDIRHVFLAVAALEISAM